MTVTQKDIERDLRAMGLKKGDRVLLHSSLASLGDVRGGADAVVNAFLGVLGQTGTLMVPHFAGGAIPGAVGKHPHAVFSVASTAVVAAVGGDAERLCAEHWKAETAHADDTPYGRLAEAGGYVCLLGVDQDRSTLLHTAEELLQLPYLKDTPPKKIDTPEGEVACSFKFFPGPHRDFIGLDRFLLGRGVMQVGRIGNAVVRLLKARDMVDACVEAGRKDPAFVLCDNPNCADCVAQRADLHRHRFGQEAFTLASSARLAGRYVPQMVENCRRAGIDAVELDGIEGRPIDMLTPKAIGKAVEELAAASVKVVGLRGMAVMEDPGALVEKAEACGVKRVVLPLSHVAAEQAGRAESKGIGISFSNGPLGSIAASNLLLQLKEAGRNVGFTFSAADFAACGEKPFLGSYKQKLRRFVDQLDVEDGLFDGTPQALAAGHAEIKEMISILRCAGFPGIMLLGARNRFCGDLVDAAERFVELLNWM